MKKSPLVEKSYLFAIKIVKSVYLVQNSKKEYILTKQLIRSGTAIAALISEGQYAQSPADFINKFSVSLKEANETKFWINLLKDTEFIDIHVFESLIFDLEEIISMLVSSIKTLKSKMSQ
ncbi:MAG TPA: four helix bundle protein [Bacteroidales bacterium]|jgi:four helix bundle protein|nr:four helix bundle protein [Bacteroidales bacterium]HPS71643.1 four helix bundle protein [Bacteroidales bacterium]